MHTHKPASIPAYPLQWPTSVPRTPPSRVEQSKFGKVDWNAALKDLHRELNLLGARYVTISTNQQLRQDGLPYAQQRKIDDAGVAVYFTLDGAQLCFPCDRWTTIAENLRAIAKHIDSMRGQQRWGVGTAKQAFAGYKALTATAGEGEHWSTVLDLGCVRLAGRDQGRAPRRRAPRHPDRGGSPGQMARINTARDRALAELAGVDSPGVPHA